MHIFWQRYYLKYFIHYTLKSNLSPLLSTENFNRLLRFSYIQRLTALFLYPLQKL